LDEWRILTVKARAWVKDGESKATWRHRYLTQQYVLILANTGMRVGELRGLRWSDLRTVKTDDGTRLIAEVRGKTGIREVVFQDGAEDYVKRIYDLRTVELEGSPPVDEAIFCHKDGAPIQTMKTAFYSLLRFAGVPIGQDYRDRKRKEVGK
jgi:site-specific recombinase XerD